MSKRRLRRNACAGKRRIPDTAAAITAAKHLRRQPGWETIHAYRCPFCRLWHLGN